MYPELAYTRKKTAHTRVARQRRVNTQNIQRMSLFAQLECFFFNFKIILCFFTFYWVLSSLRKHSLSQCSSRIATKKNMKRNFFLFTRIMNRKLFALGARLLVFCLAYLCCAGVFCLLIFICYPLVLSWTLLQPPMNLLFIKQQLMFAFLTKYRALCKTLSLCIYFDSMVLLLLLPFSILSSYKCW